ncbi:hypothetical protein AB9K35_16645 [Leisingera sp. XS_AS12]|uniref:hypothetical protein n=1 Tax=Leisingera sp. XS_AS12 TaxID=3241294 RepID=UPI003514C261
MYDNLGDNPVLRVNGISLERMRHAMKLASGFPAHGYKIDKERGWLVFMKYSSAPGMTAFPVPLEADRCAEIAFDWLQAQTYPAQPDHDGDNKEGWLLWNDGWGQVDGHGYHSFCAVRPTWIMFGK